MQSLKRIQKKIIPFCELCNWVENVRPNVEKLVFTNGCFDIIHAGHVKYLAQAADLGTKFIVFLNTDNSVKRLKGDSRPVQDQDTRALIMAAFDFVDYVCFFDEETPLNVIQKVLPDVLVKGGDYKIEEIVGFDEVIKAGGIVKTIDFVDGFSTSSILNRL
jgi:rfaE bifunctional protein nucleotidyltransferase chain/domain